MITSPGIPEQDAEGHIAGIDLALNEGVVQGLHEFGGTATTRG
jgi:hypothetical protein